jgi:dolichyl-diphosphooligosaccharide--protein glycosyltransferase
VRIWKILNISKESKEWLADPNNRICDAPGSWYCVGQYPPGLPKPPSSHKTLDYDDPNAYREDKKKQH